MESIVTVTTAADSFNLTTTQTIKTELRLTNGTLDAWIDTKLPRASAAAASYCRRTLARQTYSELIRLDFSTIDSIILSEYPVTSVTSVAEDDDAALVAGTDYEFDAVTGILYRLESDCRVCWTASKITVVYVAGYVLPGNSGRTLPADIEDATIELMKSAYFTRTQNPALKGYDIPGVVSETFLVGSPGDESGAFPPKVCSLLDPYRRI